MFELGYKSKLLVPESTLKALGIGDMNIINYYPSARQLAIVKGRPPPNALDEEKSEDGRIDLDKADISMDNTAIKNRGKSVV